MCSVSIWDCLETENRHSCTIVYAFSESTPAPGVSLNKRQLHSRDLARVRHAEQHVGAILASIHTQFLKPLFYPGNVTIFTRLDYIKTSSFKFHYEIYNDKNELAAEAQDILVYYDFDKKHKLPIPVDLRMKFDAIEKKIFDL